MLKKKRIGTRRFKIGTDARSLALSLGHYALAEIQNRGNEPEIDDFFTDTLTKISEALTGERPPIFLMLLGNVGNGKTTMLRALQASVAGASAKGLLDDSEEGYFDSCDYRTKHLSVLTAKQIVEFSRTDPQRYHELKWRRLLAIDELGAEPRETLQYGNCTEPLVTLIEERYSRQLFTAIASNLDPDEIKTHYGNRFADRLRESSLRVSYGNRPSFRGR